MFETIGPDVFQLDEVQRNVGFDYNDLNTPIQILSTNFLPLVTHFITCQGISRVANRVAIAIYLLLNKSLKLCCRISIDVNGCNPFHAVRSISHIGDVNNMQMICIAYISEIISPFSKFLFQLK